MMMMMMMTRMTTTTTTTTTMMMMMMMVMMMMVMMMMMITIIFFVWVWSFPFPVWCFPFPGVVRIACLVFSLSLFITRLILHGYFNPLVFWYQWEYLLTRKEFIFFAGHLRLAMIIAHNDDNNQFMIASDAYYD